MANKVVLSVISLVLVVGAVLGVVAVVIKNNDDSKTNTTTTSTKAVDSICKPTEYKDACTKAMGDVSKNTSATHKDYITAAFHVTLDELKKAFEKTSEVNKAEYKNVEDDIEACEDLLEDAMEELEQVLKVVSDNDEVTLAELVDPILEWLTAVRAYQSTCVDEMKDEKLKQEMEKNLEESTKLTYNAQKIVYNVRQILKDVGFDLSSINLSSLGANRKLLEKEIDHVAREGFPSWVTAADRRLLGAAGSEETPAEKPKGPLLFKTPPPPPVPANPTPNAVVALDGSGQFKTIKEALAAYPKGHQGRYIVYVKAGVYNEDQIIVEKHMYNVYMYGDGAGKTIITGDRNVKIQGLRTSTTAIFFAQGERFMAKGITFRNTIGPKGHQAVAFRSQSPHTIVVDCSIEGYQDTLYYHAHDQFYKNCEISGTVDFIFGYGRAIIQDSRIVVRKPDPNQANMVTADGRVKMEEPGGVVLQNCKIVADPELEPVKAQHATYLGRPWKASATSVMMQNEIGDHIKPEGWTQWESPEGANNHMTCMFREYANKGPGAETAARQKWPSVKVITDQNEALTFTAGKFLNGETWIPQSGITANMGLY